MQQVPHPRHAENQAPKATSLVWQLRIPSSDTVKEEGALLRSYVILINPRGTHLYGLDGAIVGLVIDIIVGTSIS